MRPSTTPGGVEPWRGIWFGDLVGPMQRYLRHVVTSGSGTYESPIVRLTFTRSGASLLSHPYGQLCGQRPLRPALAHGSHRDRPTNVTRSGRRRSRVNDCGGRDGGDRSTEDPSYRADERDTDLSSLDLHPHRSGQAHPRDGLTGHRRLRNPRRLRGIQSDLTPLIEGWVRDRAGRVCGRRCGDVRQLALTEVDDGRIYADRSEDHQHEHSRRYQDQDAAALVLVGSSADSCCDGRFWPLSHRPLGR